MSTNQNAYAQHPEKLPITGNKSYWQDNGRRNGKTYIAG